MSKSIRLSLSPADVLQILDALDSRAEAYEKTAKGHTGDLYDDDFFIPEEVRDSNEAREIAKHFRDIIATINEQWNDDRAG